MYYLPTIVAVAGVACAWEITFYKGAGCTGEILTGRDYDGASGCQQLPAATVNLQSISASGSHPSDTYHEVNFYGSNDCSGDPSTSIAHDDVCVPDQTATIHSYAINAMAVGRRQRRRGPLKRTPQFIKAEVDAWHERREMALAVRGEASSSTALAPPKQYDVSNSSLVIHNTDLDQANTYLAAALFGVTGALSFGSLVTGCIGVSSAAPISQVSCALALASTGISFMASVYHTYQTARDFRAWYNRNGVELGIRRGTKRDEIEGSFSMSHEEYMEYILHLAGVKGSHIGHHKRYAQDDIELPAYQFSGPDGMDYVFTISPDANGEVRHSLSFAHDATIVKRQGYNGVQVNGGIDIDGCQRADGRYTDLPTDPGAAYSYYSQDLGCLIDFNEALKYNYIQSDIMDRSGNVVLTVGLATWSGDQDDRVEALPVCSNEQFNFNQQCVY